MGSKWGLNFKLETSPKFELVKSGVAKFASPKFSSDNFILQNFHLLSTSVESCVTESFAIDLAFLTPVGALSFPLGTFDSLARNIVKERSVLVVGVVFGFGLGIISSGFVSRVVFLLSFTVYLGMKQQKSCKKSNSESEIPSN